MGRKSERGHRFDDSPQVRLGGAAGGRGWAGIEVTGVSREESWASSAVRRRIMQSNRSRDTKPEIAVRRVLHTRGFRFPVDPRPVAETPRRAEIVFSRREIAGFIYGFFLPCRPHHRTPLL